MADITSSVVGKEVQRSPESLGIWVCKKITPVADSVASVTTHNLITQPANSYIAEGQLIITTKMVSTSNNGTILIAIGGVGLHTALTMDGTECDAGDVFTLCATDFEDTAGAALYKTSADTLDLVVGTNAITAGVFYLIVRIVELIGE